MHIDTMCSLILFSGWRADYPDNPDFKESALIKKLVSEGKFGKKTKEGFYKYE